MDLSELATVGAKIAEVGEKLREFRGQRDEINTQIAALEKELMPLVTRHAAIIAEVVGAPVPVPAPPPPPNGGTYGPHSGPPAQPPTGPDAMAKAKKRVLAFLEDAEPGMSAADVARELNMDPLLVRQIMGQMSRAGR